MPLLDFFFPTQCLLCSKIGESFCNKCIKTLPRTLPTCPVCDKLNNRYQTHSKCLNLRIQFFTGWYLRDSLENILYKENQLNIVSPYLYLLNNLIIYLDIKDIIKQSNILPIYSNIKEDLKLNTSLAKYLNSKNPLNKDILFIGYILRDKNQIIESIKRCPFREDANIKFLTLFKTTQRVA